VAIGTDEGAAVCVAVANVVAPELDTLIPPPLEPEDGCAGAEEGEEE
jgi:hypothetical protein